MQSTQGTAGFGFDANMMEFTNLDFGLAKLDEGNTSDYFFANDEGIDTSGSQFDLTSQQASFGSMGSSFAMPQNLTMDDTLGDASLWNTQLTPPLNDLTSTPAQSFTSIYQPMTNTNNKRPLQLDVQEYPQSKRHETSEYSAFSPFAPSTSVSSWTMDTTITPASAFEIGLSDEAADVCATWFSKYAILPSDRHIESLSQLTGESPNAIRSWFGQLLKQGMVGQDSAYKSQTSGYTQQQSPLLAVNDGSRTTTTELPSCDHEATVTTSQQSGPVVRGGRKGCHPTSEPELLRRDAEKIYQCTRKCGKRYVRKCDWKRNEEEGYPAVSWQCSLCVTQGVQKVKPCFRKYHFSQHFRNVHPGVNHADYEESSVVHSNTAFPRKCGFCPHRFVSRQDRIDHIADHFKNGKCMLDWNDDANNDSDDTDDNDDNDDDYKPGNDESGDNSPTNGSGFAPRDGGSKSNGGGSDTNGSGGHGPFGGFGQFQAHSSPVEAPADQCLPREQPSPTSGTPDLHSGALARNAISKSLVRISPNDDNERLAEICTVFSAGERGESPHSGTYDQHEKDIESSSSSSSVVTPASLNNVFHGEAGLISDDQLQFTDEKGLPYNNEQRPSGEQRLSVTPLSSTQTASPVIQGCDVSLSPLEDFAGTGVVDGKPEVPPIIQSLRPSISPVSYEPDKSLDLGLGFANAQDFSDYAAKAPDWREIVSSGPDHFSKSQSFLSVKLLGTGGFSTVDEVVHRETNLRISRKTLKNRNQSAIAELKREVGVLKKLRHPHIIRFLGAYSKGDKVSILVSPVAETTLAGWLKRCAVEKPAGLPSTVIKMLGCLASTIRYLHEQRPVVKHMDIKPQNILVMHADRDIPHVVLSDFGVSSSEGTTGQSNAPITRQYCAPEVSSGISRERASDIWSLGCVFAEMLAAAYSKKNPRWADFISEFSGSEGKYYWQDVPRLHEWLSSFLSQATSSTEGSVLRTVKSMVNAEAVDRPSAATLTMVFTPAPCCVSWPNEKVFFPGPHEELESVEMLVREEGAECLTELHVGSKCEEKHGHDPFGRARGWMHECAEDHEACRSPVAATKTLPTRLLDIQSGRKDGLTVRLVDSTDIAASTGQVKYVAVSHTWAATDLILTSDRLHSMQSEFLRETLPATVLDAINAAEQLGHRFVWIDSLCVIQDDPEDRRYECSRMASVFRDAALTLVAHDPSTNDNALQRTLDNTAATSIIQSIQDTSVKPTAGSKLADSSKAHGEAMSPIDWSAPGFAWDTRAWSLQERLLCSRLLHLAGEQLYWECNALKASETFPRGLPSLVWEKAHTKSSGENGNRTRSSSRNGNGNRNGTART